MMNLLAFYRNLFNFTSRSLSKTMVSSADTKLIPVFNTDGSLNVNTINEAHDLLIKGGVVGVPTDTIYGLIGLAQDSSVISRIYKIKGRPRHNPLAICVSSIDEISKWSLSSVDNKLLSAFLPGPYTLIFERSPQLNLCINPGFKTIGIRIPDHPFLLDLAKRVGQPLALTSANISSKPSCTQIKQFSEIWPDLDAIFDGGDLERHPNNLGSTVIDLTIKGYYKITRPGCAVDQAQKILEHQFDLVKI